MVDKQKIRKAFEENKLKILSSDKEGNISLKPIKEVLRHFCSYKKIVKVKTKETSIIVTEDHSLFTIINNKLVESKPNENLNKIVILRNDSCVLEDVEEIQEIESREYMFDLSVEENENFFLSSNILAHNSFSAPNSEGTIAGFTRTRGYRWSDDSLYMHLVQACNYLNLIPPDTSFDLMNIPAPWQPLLLTQAMSYALYDLAILWINEEFSYSLNGISMDIQRSDKYMNVAQTMQAQVDTQMVEAKRRLHYVIGLAQSRYTMTYGNMFGPWNSSRMSVKRWALGFGGSQAGTGFTTSK